MSASTPSRKGVTIPDDVAYDIHHFLTPTCYEGDLHSVIIPAGMILDRVKQLAHEIHATVGDQELLMLCILKGSYRFFSTLVEEMSKVRHGCNTGMQVEFVRLKSYVNTDSTGKLEIIGLSNLGDLKGKNVLIVEDIIDSGVTLSQLLALLKDLGVGKVWTSILLSKRVKRKVECAEDFIAFNIPDKFIVGHGLDYNQVFRDLSHICQMSEAGIKKYQK